MTGSDGRLEELKGEMNNFMHLGHSKVSCRRTCSAVVVVTFPFAKRPKPSTPLPSFVSPPTLVVMGVNCVKLLRNSAKTPEFNCDCNSTPCLLERLKVSAKAKKSPLPPSMSDRAKCLISGDGGGRGEAKRGRKARKDVGACNLFLEELGACYSRLYAEIDRKAWAAMEKLAAMQLRCAAKEDKDA